MIAAYPAADEAMLDPAAEKEIEAVIEIVRAIRNVRAQYKVDASRWIEARAYVVAASQAAVKAQAGAIEVLARAKPLTIVAGNAPEKPGDPSDAGRTLVLPLTAATVVIPMASMLDLEAEKKRLQKELGDVAAEVARLEARLKDEAFLTKAPEAVVAKERQKLYTLSDKLEKLKQQSSRF
jgi:valyl-tRNA synthetase